MTDFMAILPLERKRQHRGSRAGRLCLAFALASFLAPQIGCRAEQRWPLWDSYTRDAVDGQGRVVDHSAQDRTTSEGQAYGMFFSLVANDRGHFEKLLHWTEANLADGDLVSRLPAWSWGRTPDGAWKVIDPNPASDADLWISYTLIEAGRLWHDSRYDKLGREMASRIAQQEVVLVPGLGATLMGGPVGFHPSDQTWLVNPSYLPPSVLTYFASIMPGGPWREVRDSLEPMLAAESSSGFAMDWVLAGNGMHPSPPPAKLASGTSAAIPVGSYDAIRVYLWLGLADPQTSGIESMLAATSGMASYMKTQAAPPLSVDARGVVQNPNAPVGFSAAVIPYLAAMRMKSQQTAQLARLAAQKNPATGLYGPNAAYYDQNLALFATGWAEQRYRFDREGRLVVPWR